ncbi:hypothetical protein L2729_02730 [Shewanella gelidimarina]|uniref:hypothetical protein n=1 Tax=Shewanella gelidimarina TaxID=56813 RepID=UPI00200F43D3|nr:hypothetical protein [Shewanella gelidimarina]MCL1056906.1 hypothetical protein [Shewanella gelidimarina]
MDLTWASVLKVVIAGVGTYILLPAFLILRDLLIWKLITTCILTKKLRNSVKQYAHLVHKWNSIYTVKAVEGKSGYVLGGTSVDKAKFDDHINKMDIVSDKINDLDLYIKRRSRLLGLMLEHYKHKGINPIPEWLEKEHKKAESGQGSIIGVKQN